MSALTSTPVIELAWLTTTGRRAGVRVTGTSAAPEVAAHEVGFELLRTPTTWRVRVRPSAPILMTSIKAYLHVDFARYETLFLNGYTCWTDAVERPINDRMVGLTRVPRVIIRRWALDGGGDYRFVQENALPGHQHGFSYGYLRHAKEVVLFGSLDETNGFTQIREHSGSQRFTLEKEPPAVLLEADRTYELFSFGVFEGTLRETVSAWLQASGSTCRPAPRVVGYSSWYRHYADIDEQTLLDDLTGVDDVLGNLETLGARKVFQIDDGYTTVGDWMSPHPETFPQGLRPLAVAARERGYLPGVWMAPFVCERASQLFAQHPEWLLHDDRGQLVVTGSHWSGQVALDTQLPDVRSYVRACIRHLIDDEGFGFLKLDFLYAACMLPHAGLNRGELMTDALDLLREAAGEDVLLDACGVPLVPVFGRCEYSRVGCDVGLDWDGTPPMRLLHRERVSTKRSLAITRAQAHLDGLKVGCDPEVFFFHHDLRLSVAQRMELLRADVDCGSVLFTSDDMGAWDSSQRATYVDAVHRFCAKEPAREERD